MSNTKNTTGTKLRDLKTLDDFRQVVNLEKEIWGVGYDDVVCVPILAVTVKRGGVLIGAFERDRMVGFVYSLPGIKDGKAIQWSHMLGVIDEYRNAGLGRALKLEQRLRSIEVGCDLVEWTYDPMQALNAHLNFVKLGVVVEEYAINVYGDSTSHLHKGTPTDRFIAQWWIREPHVARRVESTTLALLRAQDAADAPVVNLTRRSEQPHGGRLVCESYDLTRSDRRLWVEIPTGFTEMQIEDPQLALDWRMATREIFTTYFARGYRAVDFALDKPGGRGRYLLALRD
jgi:predicted GNAT superfamily acetyltransferase